MKTMLLKCRYCEYSKTATYPKYILELLADSSLPYEDIELWKARMCETINMGNYSGIKIHSRRMHKDVQTHEPECIITKQQEKAFSDALENIGRIENEVQKDRTLASK